MRRQVSLSSGLRADLAISSHSAACFKNSSGGLRGIITRSFCFLRPDPHCQNTDIRAASKRLFKVGPLEFF
jgi:hypothetical protein